MLKPQQVDLLWDIKTKAYELYSWSALDPKTQEFSLEIAGKVNDLLNANGLSTVLLSRPFLKEGLFEKDKEGR